MCKRRTENQKQNRLLGTTMTIMQWLTRLACEPRPQYSANVVAHANQWLYSSLSASRPDIVVRLKTLRDPTDLALISKDAWRGFWDDLTTTLICPRAINKDEHPPFFGVDWAATAKQIKFHSTETQREKQMPLKVFERHSPRPGLRHLVPTFPWPYAPKGREQ